MFPVYPALWARAEYREPAEELLAVCAERDLGVMAIKAVARRPWADRRPLADAVAGSPATAERWADSWYEPQATDGEIDRGIHFALSTPGVHAFCTPGDIALLPTCAGLGRALRADGGRRPRRGRGGDGRRGADLPDVALAGAAARAACPMAEQPPCPSDSERTSSRGDADARRT